MNDEDDDDQTDDQYDDEIKNGGINGQETGNGVNSDAKEFPETTVEEEGQEEIMLMRRVWRRLGINEVVKVWQVIGYKMDGCMSNMVEISESQGAEEGVWRQSGKDVLLIAVYAPHDFKEKLLLWDYLNRSIGRWNGKVIIMGDFNEVRYKSDRFGTVFHTQGANAFNSFIYSAGLVEVSLGSYSFTWCHKSGTMMNKLDRFLVSETLFNSCPNISALSLESCLEGIPECEQNAMINMMGKLKHLKKKIQEWNIKDKQRRSMDKDKYKVDLEALDMIIDHCNGNEEIVEQRSEIVSKLLHIDKLSSVEMAQKAKIKWSIEGDENASFFHGVINKKRNLLNIQGIMVDGSWVDEPSKVSNDKIKKAVRDYGTDKAPRPDGFTFSFYRRFWYLIDNDVYAVVKHFFIHGEIPKGCNSSFIALITKILDANLVKDFRPISLIGSLYKIIAKILANKLAGLLGDIVNEKKQSLVFKLDFKKAYDSVRWDFLDDILRKFGFGDKWRMWIQSYLKSLRGLIIINGSPTEEFQFFKGLKQEEAEMFKGIKIGPTVTLSHMFYADDVVFIRKWCESNITTLVYVLDCFHKASGLKINMSKSKILGVHVESDRVKEAALRLGCLTLKTPFLYLGSKVGGSMSQLYKWDEVVKRVKMQLSKWKMKSLSIGGRLTLLKSVLGLMTIFNMSIFKVPLGVLRTLESIRSHFFNGHALGSNKASWVSWKKVLSSKDKGGLRVSSLYALNRGLLFKWIWRFHTQDKYLWVILRRCMGIRAKLMRRLKLNTSFWEDCWIKGDSLRNRFPRLYNLESCKRITVGEKMLQPSLEFLFPRNTRGGVEQEQLRDLVTLMHDVSLSPMADRGGVEQEQLRDLVTLMHDVSLSPMADRLAAAHAASRHSKAATEAYLRIDHVATHEYFQKAQQEWSNAKKLHANASKKILAVRNCENDDWTLNLHGLRNVVKIRTKPDKNEKHGKARQLSLKRVVPKNYDPEGKQQQHNNNIPNPAGARYRGGEMLTDPTPTSKINPEVKRLLPGDLRPVPSDTPVCYLCTCEQCGNILNYGTCLKCYSGTGNSFTYDPIPESFDEVQIILNPPPQCHFNIYLCQICESNSHYEKIFSNPLFDEEIIPMKIDQHHFNAESDLIESLLNHDSSIISSSSKIDSLFDEFVGELALLKSILSGIDKTDCYPEEEIRLTKRLLYDNSSPRPPEEFVSKNSDAEIESFSPSPIPVEDSDSFMEEIDLSFILDDPMPSGIEEDDDDSERDILILEELLDNYSLSLLENKSFRFDIPSFSRPPAKPPNGNTGILNIKIMGDNSE
nr:hypothetical protein [Tanacetum cinerariifolium]